MLDKFRTLYDKLLAVKITTVLVVSSLCILIMFPLIKLAEAFGVNIRESNNINMDATFGNVFFFFLYGACVIAIIWGAQKYIHKGKLADLGFRTKIAKLLFLGFLFGVFKGVLCYAVLILSSSHVEFIPAIPDDVSILTYVGYYAYFLLGFIVWNSFIEELATRAYPIEKLRKQLNPHIIFTLLGIIFTVGHFVIHDFSVGYCLSLFITSYIFSLVYHYSNSIWLVIGIHSGINWMAFSFSGANWKLGALVSVEIYDVPTWVYECATPALGLLLLLLIVYSHKKGFFKKLSLEKK
jgi:membrane protease YdiL (CAAX protease family)